MALLKPHILAMHADMHMALVVVERALNQPNLLARDALVNTPALSVAELETASRELHVALSILKNRVFATVDCDESNRTFLARRFHGAVRALVNAYADSLGLLETAPGEPSIRLERAARANLERLAMWLADIVTTLADPERLLWESDNDDGRYKRTHNLQLSFPTDEAELGDWIVSPTGYDASQVTHALHLVPNAGGRQIRCFPGAAALPSFVKPARQAKSSSDVWGTLGAVVLGVAIYNSFFGDDCDRDA